MSSIPGFGVALLKRAMDLANKAYYGKSSFGSNLIKYSTDNKKYHPNYFVVDEPDILFLVVRGSGSEADWQTNFDYHEQKINFGKYPIFCHNGFYQSAKNIFDEVKSTVLEKGANKKVIVTGHSLGGAVTSPLALLFMTSDDTKKLNTYAIPFAPAPSLGFIPKDLNSRFATIVNNDDIVTTLCIPCLYNMIKPLIPPSGIPKAFLKAVLKSSLKSLKSSSVQFGDNLYNSAMASIDSIVEDLSTYHNDKTTLRVKYISGIIYHPKENAQLSKSIVSPASFTTLSISVTCITDHIPSKYINLISSLSD